MKWFILSMLLLPANLTFAQEPPSGDVIQEFKSDVAVNRDQMAVYTDGQGHYFTDLHSQFDPTFNKPHINNDKFWGTDLNQQQLVTNRVSKDGTYTEFMDPRLNAFSKNNRGMLFDSTKNEYTLKCGSNEAIYHKANSNELEKMKSRGSFLPVPKYDQMRQFAKISGMVPDTYVYIADQESPSDEKVYMGQPGQMHLVKADDAGYSLPVDQTGKVLPSDDQSKNRELPTPKGFIYGPRISAEEYRLESGGTLTFVNDDGTLKKAGKLPPSLYTVNGKTYHLVNIENKDKLQTYPMEVSPEKKALFEKVLGPELLSQAFVKNMTTPCDQFLKSANGNDQDDGDKPRIQ